MANLNKVMLIGRLTRDPEVRTISTGTKVAQFGFAVNRPFRRKNPETGQFEDEPVFIDITAWNARAEAGRQLADLCEQYLRKGHQAFIEGHLQLDQWTDKDGQKRSKLKVVMDNLQFLQPRESGGGEGGMPSSRGEYSGRGPARPAPSYGGSLPAEPMEPPESHGDGDIPF
jgi:single-strand DNA-binding protein